MSPYQTGTGWIGGPLPATICAMNAEAGNTFSSHRYPVAIVSLTFGLGLLFLAKARGRDIDA
ncbi:hypothetical protein [Muricoccus aerilatus]|uniref:hypothetical protein n=1 Tax=Muricoccus aerilatus TaxID=452982 RepID=UPI0005C1D222|nr:hypothetical protein [Roseomonas aerilata]